MCKRNAVGLVGVGAALHFAWDWFSVAAVIGGTMAFAGGHAPDARVDTVYVDRGVEAISRLRSEWSWPDVPDTVARVASLIRTGEPDVRVPYVPRPREDPALYRTARTVVGSARHHGVDPELLARLIWVESRGDSLAVSRVGAVGLAQIMPRYWAGAFPDCGDDLRRVRTNVCYGARILRIYMDRNPGDLREALLQYNGCVTREKCSWYAGSVARHYGLDRDGRVD